jgi:HEAT repeat protein
VNISPAILKVKELIAPVFPDALEDLGNGEYLAKWWKPAPQEDIAAFQNLAGITILKEPFEPRHLPGGIAICFSATRHKHTTDSVNRLINELTNPDFTRSKQAKEALTAIGSDALDPLVEALQHASNKQCWEIIRIITEIGDPGPSPIIADFLTNENGAVRTAAAQCLGQLGDPHATLPLIKSIKWNINSGALIWIIQALGQLKDERAVDPLLEVMEITSSPAVRYTAIEALGVIGATRAIEPIRACLDDESHHVRSRAQKALHRLKNKMGPAADLAVVD